MRIKGAPETRQERTEGAGFAFDKPAATWQIARQL
jgi:hypothetical protein